MSMSRPFISGLSTSSHFYIVHSDVTDQLDVSMNKLVMDRETSRAEGKKEKEKKERVHNWSETSPTQMEET